MLSWRWMFIDVGRKCNLNTGICFSRFKLLRIKQKCRKAIFKSYQWPPRKLFRLRRTPARRGLPCSASSRWASGTWRWSLGLGTRTGARSVAPSLWWTPCTERREVKATSRIKKLVSEGQFAFEPNSCYQLGERGSPLTDFMVAWRCEFEVVGSSKKKFSWNLCLSQHAQFPCSRFWTHLKFE